MHLQDCYNPNSRKYRPDSERVLFNIYCGDDDEEAFKQAVKAFGASYDLIAYLFYIKDPEKYLPIHPRSFEKGLRQIGVDWPHDYEYAIEMGLFNNNYQDSESWYGKKINEKCHQLLP